jgi:hypothetical protein
MYRGGGAGGYNNGNFREYQQRYPANNSGYSTPAQPQRLAQQQPSRQPLKQQQPYANYYDQPQQQPVRRQPVVRQAPAATPVRRINSNTQPDYGPRRQSQLPAQTWSDDEFEQEPEFRGSSIRTSPPARSAVAFKSAEASLCLVPQTPSVLEIAKLLKGDKGDRGEQGDSYFEYTVEDPTTVRLRMADHLRIPGRLSVDQLEIRNPRSLQLLAAGEGFTSEDGSVTIQLSREFKGTWNASNAKVLLTPRQACGQLFVPQNGFDPESNQFSIQCTDKQRVAFDWFFYRI